MGTGSAKYVETQGKMNSFCLRMISSRFMGSPLLELARPLFGPALDDDFLFRVELDSVASLTVQNPEEAVLPSAEWEVSHRGGDSDVHADIPRRSFVAELARRRAAGRKDRSGIAVGGSGKNFDGLVKRLGRRDAEDGPEDLSPCEFTGCGQTVEDGRLEEVSIRSAAIEHRLCTFLDSLCDQPLNAFFAGVIDDRPHLVRLCDAWAGFYFCGCVRD